MAKPQKKPKKIRKKKHGGGNPRGRKPDAAEAAKMDGDGYVSVAAAARAVNRAATSIYDRVRRHLDGDTVAIPQLVGGPAPVKKGPSGNVWIHLATLQKAFEIPAAS